MPITLSTLLQNAYRELGELNQGMATGGSTTTCIDTVLALEAGDNAWKNGTLFVVRDGGGASAAPEGEFARISKYETDSGTFTTLETLTAAIASGDEYAFAGATYPLKQMVQYANDALWTFGELPLVDKSTHTTAAQQSEYAAQVEWKDAPPTRIDIQGKLDDANDYQWEQVFDWEYEPAAAGSAGLIIFSTPLPAGRLLRIWYRGLHPRVYAYSASINETIPAALCVVRVALAALRGRIKRDPNNEGLMRDLNELLKREADLMVMMPQWQPRKQKRYLIPGGGGDSDDFRPQPTS